MYILRAQVLPESRAARGLLLRKLVAAVYVLSLSALSLLIPCPISAQGTTLQIKAGGSAAPPFQGDRGFTPSSTIAHSNAIDTTKVLNPAPVSVYQTGRIGNFTYTLGGFVPGADCNSAAALCGNLLDRCRPANFQRKHPPAFVLSSVFRMTRFTEIVRAT
jgi:hypothetical protein